MPKGVLTSRYTRRHARMHIHRKTFLSNKDLIMKGAKFSSLLSQSTLHHAVLLVNYKWPCLGSTVTVKERLSSLRQNRLLEFYDKLATQCHCSQSNVTLGHVPSLASSTK